MSATNASKLLETLREMYGLEISCDSRCPFCSKEKAEEFENIYDDTKLNIIVIHNCVLCLLELLSRVYCIFY